jgi:predicted  nucleic acid-binding Zn-ribbon protein
MKLKVSPIHIYQHMENEDQILHELQHINHRLEIMENQMSALTDAVQALSDSIAAATARIDEDVAHLNDLLTQALATETANQAVIAQLTQEAADVTASITAQTTALNAIDPVNTFPVVEAPEV